MISYKKLLMALFLFGLSVGVQAACSGRVYNPMTDTAWNFAMPIKVSGAPVSAPTGGSVSQPPAIESMPAVCICPGKLTGGAPTPGVGTTYWEPRFIIETTQEPGCLSSLGTDLGLVPLGFESGSRSSGGTNDSNSRINIHYYAYPLFEIVGSSFDFACGSFDGAPGVGDMYMSEVDPVWNVDQLSILQSPEAVLFSNPIAQASCAIDAAASAFDFPIDYQFWCQGSDGSEYPLSGNMNTSQSDMQANKSGLTKFIGSQSRRGLMWNTVGPSAQCSAHPAFFLRKSQYRVDQVTPIPYQGPPVYPGKTELTWGYTGGGGGPVNLPQSQDAAFMIWQGRQCCMTP